MTEDFLISTSDNPYSPFSDFSRWYAEDLALGYDTCGLVARLAKVSELDEDIAIDNAMRTIVEYNFSGKHIVVRPSDYAPLLSIEAPL